MAIPNIYHNQSAVWLTLDEVNDLGDCEFHELSKRRQHEMISDGLDCFREPEKYFQNQKKDNL